MKNDNVDAFIDYVKCETKSKGIKCILSPSKYVVIKSENNMRCNGYFWDKEAVLKCAINKPFDNWFPVLVHEFSHFEQWSSGSKIWIDYANSKCSEVFFDWVNGKDGKDVDLSLVKESYLMIKELERDCEKRTLKNIVKFNLPIDCGLYIRRSNAYVLFYDYLYKYQKWYKTGKAPYESLEVLSFMPDKLVGKGRVATKVQMELFGKYCF